MNKKTGKPKQRAKEKKLRPYHYWYDDTAPGEAFTHRKIVKRLKEVHGIDPKTTRGTRRLIVHIDGDTWFTSVYEWEIGGKIFAQHIRCNRRGEDLAMWTAQS